MRCNCDYSVRPGQSGIDWPVIDWPGPYLRVKKNQIDLEWDDLSWGVRLENASESIRKLQNIYMYLV